MAIALGLVLSRPRILGRIQISFGAAAWIGALLMLFIGAISFSDAGDALEVLWQPLLTIASIMLITHVALVLGVIEKLTSLTLPLARGSTQRLFTTVFIVSAATSAVLNNDAAVLLLTPLVVFLVRRVYGTKDAPVVPFAFAVFMAAGVAPLVVSNPMNMIVADYAGIGFNRYAQQMLPISIVGWVVSYVVLHMVFRSRLAAVREPPDTNTTTERWTAPQVQVLAILGLVLVAYPFVSYLRQPIWIVAVAGAILELALCRIHTRVGVSSMLRTGIGWDTLAFLAAVFLMALGLRHVGFVDWLSTVYEGAGVGLVGSASAVGSAVINNHPMALINLLAIESTPGVGQEAIFAALIGGDLGPRLLPMGSLAGLLWFSSLHRIGVEVSVAHFFVVGLMVTLPSLAVSLLLLEVL
jgi:arsenical pump membrane protein